MSDPTTAITAPPAVPPAARAREGIAAALLLSLVLHAVVILGLSEWFEEGAEAPSIVRATLARASGSPATTAPPSSTAESEGEGEGEGVGPVSEPLLDTRDTGTVSETSQPSNAIASGAGEDDTTEPPWRKLDYAATVRQIADLDVENPVGNPVGNPGAQTRVRRIIEERTQTPEDDWYLESWRRKVERIGKLNYPEQARERKLYGSLRLLVAIEPDGSLRDVRVIDSSGHKVLDEAAVRIVRLAAPYAPFPPGMRKQTDVLEIVRTWQFKKRGYASPS